MAFNMSIFDCSLYSWIEYKVHKWDSDTSQYIQVAYNNFTNALDECDNTGSYHSQILTTPEMNTNKVLFEVINTNGTGVSMGTFITEMGTNSNATITSFTECPYPQLFCDTFEYSDAMRTREWQITRGIDINDTFAPISNRFNLTESGTSIIGFHETRPFSTSYYPDAEGIFTKHYQSPVFSSEFILIFDNTTNNIFEYWAYEKFSQTAYCIRAEVESEGNSSGNMGWYFLNETEPNFEWIELCRNCSLTGTELNIKIISYFSQREDFPFNSSIQDDEIVLYIDGSKKGTVEDYLYGINIDYLSQYEFTKYNVGSFTIDDYYVSIGTDKNYYTGQQYYTDFYDNRTEINETFGKKGTNDMAFAVSTIWNDFGLISQTSRIMTGLFLMFFLAVVMYGITLSTGNQLSTGVLILVELFFMILLTYIKLLPIWLPFVIIILSAGLGALIVKSQTSE